MARGKSTFTNMICEICKNYNYTTIRNKKTFPKLELKKSCPNCKKHTMHKSKDTKS